MLMRSHQLCERPEGGEGEMRREEFVPYLCEVCKARGYEWLITRKPKRGEPHWHQRHDEPQEVGSDA